MRIGSLGRSGGAHCPDLDCRSSHRIQTQVTVDSSTRSNIPVDLTLHRAAVRTSCLALQICCDSFRRNNQLAVILLSTSGYFKRRIYFRFFDPNPIDKFLFSTSHDACFVCFILLVLFTLTCGEENKSSSLSAVSTILPLLTLWLVGVR